MPPRFYLQERAFATPISEWKVRSGGDYHAPLLKQLRMVDLAVVWNGCSGRIRHFSGDGHHLS